MTRKEAIHRIMECIDRAPHMPPDIDTRRIGEQVLEELDSALHFEPTIVELAATLKGVGRMSQRG